MPTTWTPQSSQSTNWGSFVAGVVYDESGKTYDTLATYYDGNTYRFSGSVNWSGVASTSTAWTASAPAA